MSKFYYHLLKITLLFFFAAYGTAYSQSSNVGNCNQISQNRKPAYYSRAASKSLKNGSPLMATANAALYLAKAEKKRQVRKAGEQLGELLPAVPEIANPIPGLLETSAVVKGEMQYRQLIRILCEYNKRNVLHEALNQIPADRLNTNGLTQMAKAIPEYKEEVSDVQKAIDSAKIQIADFYYFLAEATVTNGNRLSTLNKLKYCNQSLQFNPRHEKARTLAKALKNQAHGTYVLLPLRNSSGKSLNTNGAQAIFIDAMLKEKNIPHYHGPKLGSEEANISIEISIQSASFEQKKGEPRVKERSGKDGEKTITAKYIRYTKTIYAKLNYSYIVKDLDSGKTLSSGKSEARGSSVQFWASYTGNINALKKSERKAIKSEPKWDNPSKAYGEATTYAIKRVASATATVFRNEGRLKVVDEFPVAIRERALSVKLK